MNKTVCGQEMTSASVHTYSAVSTMHGCNIFVRIACMHSIAIGLWSSTAARLEKNSSSNK